MKIFASPRSRYHTIAAICFLLPNLLGFLCFTAGPVLLSLYMSFTNWSLKPAVDLEWVGLRNYIDLLTDTTFWFYLYNTIYLMAGIPFSMAGSLLLANLLVDTMLIRGVKKRAVIATITLLVGISTFALFFVLGQKDTALILGILFIAGAAGVFWGSMSYRTMLYVPSFAAGVATIILWSQVFNPYHGLANNLLNLIGFADTPMWLTSTKSLLGFLPLPTWFNDAGFGLGAREAILIMGVWMGVGGNNMILYIAAIANIPQDLYEAAEIDGAGSFSKFWHITLPSVAPTTFFIFIMAVIGGLQGGFDVAKIMTNGGPAGITTTLAYYIYTAGFDGLDFGFASAVAWTMFVLIFGMTIINWKYGNRKMGDVT
jgi:multiple sugar transport system permease protein